MTGGLVIPAQGYHTDPVTLFRGRMPIDSNAMRKLPDSERRVAIAYKASTGEIMPPSAKIIWPFLCNK